MRCRLSVIHFPLLSFQQAVDALASAKQALGAVQGRQQQASAAAEASAAASQAEAERAAATAREQRAELERLAAEGERLAAERAGLAADVDSAHAMLAVQEGVCAVPVPCTCMQAPRQLMHRVKRERRGCASWGGEARITLTCLVV